MADDAPQSAVSASLACIEANIVIAGAEASTGAWVVYRAHTGQCLAPAIVGDWHWSFAVYAVVAFLGVVLAGFALEAVAGLVERAITRPLWGSLRATPWPWYSKFTLQPDRQNILSAQKWIWKSTQANQEFSRRRLRILVARNTAAFWVAFTAAWLLLVGWSPLLLPVGLFGFALFTWLWLDAQKAWNLSVIAAHQLGEP